MPKSCVKKKMKQGMSAGKAVAACYPRATKAAKKVILAAVTPGIVRGVSAVVKRAKKEQAESKKRLAVKRATKEIKKSKPPKMKIRKVYKWTDSEQDRRRERRRKKK